MFTKFLIISLLQVVLARNIPNAKPYYRTNVNTEQQVHSTDQESENYQRNQDAIRSTDFNDYGSFTGGNYKRERYTTQNERDSLRNNGYQVENEDSINQYDRETHALEDLDHSTRRYHNINRNRAHSRANDDQDRLKTNLDTNVHSSSDRGYTGETVQDNISYHQQDDETQVRTNKKSTDNTHNMQSENVPIEITTVPIIHLKPVTLKINPNFHSRFADVGGSSDNTAEVRYSDGVTFGAIDNPESNTSDKVTTDNEVRYNRNGEEDNSDDHTRWVWDSGSTVATTLKVETTPTPTEAGSMQKDLDDRTSFNGDKCPQGLAKVGDSCIKTH